MSFFKKKMMIRDQDRKNQRPVLKTSICTGKQVAGFKDIHTGRIEENASILDMTVSYLRIIFVGLVFTFLYSYAAGNSATRKTWCTGNC